MPEKITTKINALPKNGTYFSLEFFPPKTPAGFSNLQTRLERMAKGLRPLFVNVTWGAGGSTATKSLELASLCQDLGLTTVLHLTCTNMSKSVLDDALENAKLLGIRNILALRGDAPRDHEYLKYEQAQTRRSGSNTPTNVNGNGTRSGSATPPSGPEFVYAVDLVRYIRQKYDDFFCIGVAGYPEGYAEGSYPERQSVQHDLPYLREKTSAGADFIMTQLFYDVEAYLSYEKTLREDESGLFKKIPIIPGLMPIQSHQIFRRTTKLCNVKIPADILQKIEEVKADDEAVKTIGIEILTDIAKRIKSEPNGTAGPRGFHFYTLNLEKAVAHILERTDLIPEIEPTVVPSTGDDVAVEETSLLTVNGTGPRRNRRTSSIVSNDPHNRVIVDNLSSVSGDFQAGASEAGHPKEMNQEGNIAISEGEGALGREATWDDFPNGRWGDARSPAFGEIDGYGVSLHRTPTEAIRLWGHPTSRTDISELFVKHVKGEVSAMPWTEDDLSSESLLINEELVRMNAKGWWTVASQPAVNSARSDDRTFGWGPKNGFVFQKAFVEFFIPEGEWAELRKRVEGDEMFSFYAGNAAGDFEASENADPNLNAVTWGAFPGKEIVTPTIIEEVSFKAWRDEAFAIWTEWQRIYPLISATSKFLGEERKKTWLVTIISHDYMDADALWKGVLGL